MRYLPAQETPQRLKLKNKIYYTLTHHRQFALWKNADDEWLCGLSAWRNHEMARPATRLELLRRDPSVFEQAALPCGDIRQLSSPDLLAAIFDWAQTPVKLDDVIATVAELLGIRDQAETDQSSANKPERVATAQSNITTEVEQRIYLQRIWAEIGQLPLRQRSALLLNLTDSLGHGVIALLPVIGIATFEEIAEALGITAEQLGELWNSLPLDDASIALQLGVTRQQVINLRKSARERLLRRMNTKGGSRELVFSTARG